MHYLYRYVCILNVFFICVYGQLSAIKNLLLLLLLIDLQKQSMTQYYTDHIHTVKKAYTLSFKVPKIQFSFYFAFKVIKVQHSNTHV